MQKVTKKLEVNIKPICFILTFILSACASNQPIKNLREVTSPACLGLWRQADEAKDHKRLNLISDLFAKACYHEVINLSEYARAIQRDKFYNVTAEAAEVFVPEGTFTEYVMESFERGMLAVLASISYLRMGKEDDALVELRRASVEQNADLYNSGEDPIVALLMATMWDRFDSSMARPFWKYLSELNLESHVSKDSLGILKKFSTARLIEIDKFPGQKKYWLISGFGKLPKLTWKSDFLWRKQGPYDISTETSFPKSCQNENELFISTEAWVEKIATRYKSEYHPFLFAKSLARVPVGLGYGIIGTTAGVAVGVGGCGIASYGNGGNNGGGELCRASIGLAGEIIKSSANLVEYTLSPDLRHWNNLPMALSISSLQSTTLTDNESIVCDSQKSSLISTINLTLDSID